MEIKILIVWYLLFFVFGIIGLPITSFIFKNWEDKGYAFAKYIGLFVVAMIWWLLSSIRILPFTPVVGYVLFGIATVASLYWLYKSKFKITKLMLIEEAIFLVVFVIWSWIRSFNPRAEGTEKMMNLAFMNSLNLTEYMPPKDMWFAQGGNINYYYLGHYYFVVAGKLGNIAMSYVYNLALVTIIAQTFVGLFALFMELFKKSKNWIKLTFALVGATWISFAGNLHMAYTWFVAFFNGETFSYFFPDSTRIIEYTINEFPGYSIVLGDVHGHYLALPFLIIILSLALVSIRTKINSTAKLRFNFIISFLVMALYGINSWDMITALFIFTVIHLYQVSGMKGELEDKIKTFLKATFALIVPGAIFILPYIINYSPAVGPDGGFPLGIVPFRTKSEPLPWLQIWSQFLIAPLLFVIAVKLKIVKNQAIKIYPLALTAVAISLIIGVEFFFLKDIFHTSNPPYFRTNTVFKFYYHAWVIFGVAAVWFIYAILESKEKAHKWFKWLVFAISVSVFIMTFSYIFKAVNDFYPLSDENAVQTLDGINYIAREKESDYEAIQWIKENIDGQPVILEYVGEAYTYASRVSSTTGLVTVVGWPTHQWQWRGSSAEPFARKGEVEAFYNGANTKEQDKEFIEKYDLEYIFIGGEEIKNYKIDNERINSFGELVYEDGLTSIIKINRDQL